MRIDESIASCDTASEHDCDLCHTAPCDCGETDEDLCLGCSGCLAELDGIDEDDEQEEDE